MARYTYVVFTEPTEGREDVYNEWYDNTHLADVLSVPGFISARRFRVWGKMGALTWRYLALYEMETDDPKKTLKTLRAAGLPVSDALDRTNVCAVVFEEIASLGQAVGA
jgi:hypothetical protein